MTWMNTFEFRKDIGDYDNRYELSFVHNLPLYLAFPIAMPWIGSKYGVDCPRILVIGLSDKLEDKIKSVLSSVKEQDFIPVRYMNAIEYDEFDSLDTAKRISGKEIPCIDSWASKVAYMEYIESSYPIDMNKVNEILSPDYVVLVGVKPEIYPFKDRIIESEPTAIEFGKTIKDLFQGNHETLL